MGSRPSLFALLIFSKTVSARNTLTPFSTSALAIFLVTRFAPTTRKPRDSGKTTPNQRAMRPVVPCSKTVPIKTVNVRGVRNRASSSPICSSRIAKNDAMDAATIPRGGAIQASRYLSGKESSEARVEIITFNGLARNCIARNTTTAAPRRVGGSTK